MRGGRPEAVPSQPGEGGSGGFLSGCSCPQIKSCGSVRVAKEALLGMCDPKCYTGLTLSQPS